jgi:F-type H+-transporting ATPase subunit alpha
VGGSAQSAAMKDKDVGGSLKLYLAQYRELAAFAAFGSDLDEASRQKLNRGVRLIELLKQDQYTPVSAHIQIIQIYSGNMGVLDDVPVQDVKRFLNDLAVHFEGPQKAITDELAQKLTFKNNDLKARILAAANAFRKSWK